jgi:hypothetical protein
VSTSISPPFRIVAIVGTLLIVLASAGFVYLRLTKTSTPPAVSTPAATTPAHTTAAATTPAATTPAHEATPPPAQSKVQTPRVDPLLPPPLRAALERNKLVVVGLYDPQVRVDALSLAEARAGAAEAHVGFLRVSLLNDRVAGTLTALLPSGEMLPVPGFLVYRRPGKLVYRFDGYLDRNAVAQAVVATKP